MRLLRSEELPDPARGRMSMATLSALARDWYGDRLDPAWSPRSIAASQQILERHGLVGDFWQLTA